MAQVNSSLLSKTHSVIKMVEMRAEVVDPLSKMARSPSGKAGFTFPLHSTLHDKLPVKWRPFSLKPPSSSMSSYFTKALL